MKEYPILFNGEMVRAVLEDRKTQTRRPIRFHDDSEDFFSVKNPFGVRSDRLWVRETHWRYGQYVKALNEDGKQVWRFEAHNNIVRFESQPKTSDRTICGWHCRPSIFMPAGSARIILEVVNVRVDRLQEISEEDAEAEGIEMPNVASNEANGWTFSEGFSKLWDSIYKDLGYGWDANPWVFVGEFRRMK